ncbi:MAG: membrane protein [Gammaproteobacteria bacterium BRH_c0]|nr:MAG: membrane protein [Gammaproteobacteria bacterium BRH_c0]
MYKIDPAHNRITPIEAKRFAELRFGERKHLQEWLEHCPQALAQGDGEELLIIQKEFDGFDDTRERLDLLALDKEGNLVIIENKLDDSGRDVVWQALKYASYCASLSTQQVVDIYQRYLNQKAVEENSAPARAEDRLIEFLEVDDLESVQLNRIRTQRLMLVAARYRKEVTSTVLWLSQFGIACQCFKVTPYQAGSELFLNVEQIIPTPESSDFMIGMVAKEVEEKSADNEQKQRHRLRLAFWELALDKFSHSQCSLYNNISPGKDHWLYAGSGVSSVPYSIIFAKNEVRVELNIGRKNPDENRFIFQRLCEQKDSIETAFGAPLEWLPLPEKKSCRIQYAKAVDGYDKAQWPAMIDWLVDHMTRLEIALKEPLKTINQQLKHSGGALATMDG